MEEWQIRIGLGTPEIVSAAWVRYIRRRLGMSQVIFAENVGTRAQTVQQWEAGKVMPTFPFMVVMIALDVAATLEEPKPDIQRQSLIGQVLLDSGFFNFEEIGRYLEIMRERAMVEKQ